MTKKTPDSANRAGQRAAAQAARQHPPWDLYVTFAVGEDEPPWAGFYQQSRSVAQQWMDQVVDAQSHWAHQCIDTIAAHAGQADPSDHWAQDMNRLVDEWAEAERRLGNACLPATPWQAPFVDPSATVAALDGVWRAWISTGQEALILQSALASRMAKKR